MNLGGAIRALISFLIFVVLHYTLRPLLGWRAPMDFLVLALLLAAVRVRPATAAVIGFLLGLVSDSLAPDALGAGAIRELDQIAVPTSADQAQNYWWIRGRSAFLTGHPVEGTRALVERERWLTDPVSVGANRAELYSRVRSAAERGQPLSAPRRSHWHWCERAAQLAHRLAV